MPDFVHLHVHSQYSRFDGFASPKELAKTTKTLGMKACALTDHGNVAGTMEMVRACREEGIKPIVGMEGYLAADRKARKTVDGKALGKKSSRHINIMAKNFAGIQSLYSISQAAFLEGMYYNPRLDMELLNEHREGLIVTSACPNSLINTQLAAGDYEKAKKACGLFKDLFGDDFYLEVMWHGLEIECKTLPEIQRLSKDMGVKMIATNDVHYVQKNDAEFHEIIMCMSGNRCIKDPNRLKFPYQEFYLKSPEEMASMFRPIPSAIRNTVEVAEKCDYSDLVFLDEGGVMRLPHYEVPAPFNTPYEYLEHLAYAGAKQKKYDQSLDHMERLKKELGDIKLVLDTKGYDFATYFLVVWDLIKYAKTNNIDCGVRGSGYGSLLMNCLGMTEGLDPLKFMWERFLGFDDQYFVSDADLGIKGKT